MKNLLASLLLLFCSISSASAYDALVDGVYYNFIGSRAYVTYPGDNIHPQSDYAGQLSIPASIQYGGRTYKVFSVGEGSFESCKGLTSITLPSSVLSLNACAFAGCEDLQQVSLPTSLKTICGGSFCACTSLQSILIPEAVSILPDMTFYGCTNLQTVELPASIDSIGERVFEYCPNLKEFRCAAAKVPTTDAAAFAGLDLSQCSLTVPEAAVWDYLVTYPWSQFGFINGETPTSIASAKTDAQPTDIYSVDGKKQHKAQRLSILRYTDGTTRKVLK